MELNAKLSLYLKKDTKQSSHKPSGMEQERQSSLESIYTKSYRESLLDADELSSEEEGFMQGYEEEDETNQFIHKKNYEEII